MSKLKLSSLRIRVKVFLTMFTGLFFIEISHAIEREAEKPDKLRVLIWNVWHGTNDVDKGAEKALQLIKDSKADICLLQESYDIKGPRGNFGPWAAEQLKWNAWQSESPHLCVISRYTMEKKFFHQPWHALGVELKDEKGRAIHAFSVWLDYKAYMSYHLRDHPDATTDELLACETKNSGRFKQVQAILEYLKTEKLDALKTPLLVGGDWNCPSHLDWTKETTKAFHYRKNLPLPVSLEMTAAGFKDTFRMVHPDPVKQPGNTWTPLFRKKKGVAQPMDRIDRLYYLSNHEKPLLRAVKTTVYPEKLEANDIPTWQRKFPSDHSAVLIEFEWTDGK